MVEKNGEKLPKNNGVFVSSSSLTAFITGLHHPSSSQHPESLETWHVLHFAQSARIRNWPSPRSHDQKWRASHQGGGLRTASTAASLVNPCCESLLFEAATGRQCDEELWSVGVLPGWRGSCCNPWNQRLRCFKQFCVQLIDDPFSGFFGGQ